jgi:predicted lipoprotein with Yx(FWY)xxD motif
MRWALLSALLLGGTAVAADVEAHMDIPMPPGFQVINTELEGPVFADAKGRTVYYWPSKKLRNGYSGEMKGKPTCDDVVLKETAGLMSPYPAGLLLPELDKRPSCAQLWPALVAAADAKPIGKWSILTRKDGRKQWAFDEQPLYTSIRDQLPGDTIGGSGRKEKEIEDAPAGRAPLQPPPKVPPGFAVKTTSRGRLLTTAKNYSVYVFDKDTATQSQCVGDCLRTWSSLIAPQLARAQGEWGLLERSPGVKQWTFRGKPLYTYELDSEQWSQEGSDVQGWRNVYTQRAPAPPAGFTVQDSTSGEVLADARGRTIYVYYCGDDSVDQLACDHPNDTQVYRLAMCGGGDAAKCLVHWPYVLANKNARSNSRAWSVLRIDPKTGRIVAPDQADALSVWAYRERPVYTYGSDQKPGDIHGDSTGEWRGYRNGLKAFWLRDDYYSGAL